jgi:hypothetical protein
MNHNIRLVRLCIPQCRNGRDPDKFFLILQYRNQRNDSWSGVGAKLSQRLSRARANHAVLIFQGLDQYGQCGLGMVTSFVKGTCGLPPDHDIAVL